MLFKKGTAILNLWLFVFLTDKIDVDCNSNQIIVCCKALNQWAALCAAPTTRACEQIYDIARTYFRKNF